MAGNLLGMDVLEIRRIGTQLQTESRNLEALLSRVDKQVQAARAAWLGTDSDHFVEDWQQRRSQLQSLSSRLDSLGRQAMNQADQQARVSGVA